MYTKTIGAGLRLYAIDNDNLLSTHTLLCGLVYREYSRTVLGLYLRRHIKVSRASLSRRYYCTRYSTGSCLQRRMPETLDRRRVSQMENSTFGTCFGSIQSRACGKPRRCLHYWSPKQTPILGLSSTVSPLSGRQSFKRTDCGICRLACFP
jgi:hypothetical protein